MAKIKAITIYQENNPPIFITDEDDRSKDEYAKELSEFMRLTNVSILETSHSAVIIKPSQISSIHIEEANALPDEKDKEKLVEKKPRKKPVRKPAKKETNETPKKEEPMDIITDVD